MGRVQYLLINNKVMKYILYIVFTFLLLTGCSTDPPLEFGQVHFFIDDNCGDGQSRQLLLYSTSDSTNWVLVDSFSILSGRKDEKAFFTSRTILIQLVGDEACRTNFYSLPVSSSGQIRMQFNTNVNGTFNFTKKSSAYDSIRVVVNRGVLNLNHQSVFFVDDISNSSQLFTTNDFQFSKDNLSSNALYQIQILRYRNGLQSIPLNHTFYTQSEDFSLSIDY